MKITFSNLNKINVEAFEDIFLLDNYLDIIAVDCSNMNLKELPNDLIYLINLRTLICFNNELSSLPDNLKVETLILDYNKFVEIPIIKSLKKLSLSCNNIKVISANISELENLKVLILFNNKISQISKNIGALLNLEKLVLVNNELASVPNSITNLINLKRLELCNNNIKILPKKINKMKNLEDLRIDKNQLMYLPKEIGKLENIKVLFFNYNKIKFIPKSFNKLENLKFISLLNNPIYIENELLKDKIIFDVTKLCSFVYSNTLIEN